MDNKESYELVYCQGVEGNSIYLNDYRIAGPKPWGGGKVLKKWTVTRADIFRAIEEVNHD